MIRLLADSRVSCPAKYSLISAFRPPLRYSSSSIVNLQATAAKNVELISKVIVEEKAKKGPKDVSNQELSSLATFIPPEGTTSEPLSVTTTPIQTQQHDLQDTDDTDVHELLFQSRREARIRILRKLLDAKNPSEVQSILSSDYFYSKKYQSYFQSEKEARELLERLKWFQEQGFNINDIFLKSLKLSIKTMSFRKRSLEEFGIDVNNYVYLHGEVFLKIMLAPIAHIYGPEVKKFKFLKTRKQIKTVDDSLTPNQVISEILKKYDLTDCFSQSHISDLIRLPIREVRYRIINEAVRKKFGDRYNRSFQDIDMRIPTPLSDVIKTVDILSRDKHCMENLEHINLSLVVSRLSPDLLQDFLTRYPFLCHRHISRYFGNSYIAMFVRGVDSLKESVDFMISLKVDPYRLAHFPNLFVYNPSTLKERAKYWLNAFGPDAFRSPRIADLIQTHKVSVLRFENLFKKTPTTVQNLFESHSTIRRRVMAGKRKMLEVVCCRFKIDSDLLQSSLHRHPHFNQEKIFEDSTVEMFSLLIEQEGFSVDQVAQSGALVMFSARDVKKTLKEIDTEQGLNWRSLKFALDMVLYRLDKNSAVQLGKPFVV